MTGELRLVGPAYSLGERRCSYKDIDGFDALLAERNVPNLPDALGFGAYHATSDVYALAASSVMATLEKAGIAAPQVDGVIVSSSCFLLDFTAQNAGLATVLARNRLEPSTLFGVTGTGCVAALSAIELASLLVRAGELTCALVLNLDYVQTEGDRGRFIGYAILSDSAASAIVTGSASAARGHRICGFSKRTSVQQMAKGISALDLDGNAEVVGRALRAARVDVGQVEKVLTNNTFWPVKKSRDRALGFGARQLFLSNTPRIGHCLAGDVLINLADQEAASGKHFLLHAEANGHCASLLVES